MYMQEEGERRVDETTLLKRALEGDPQAMVDIFDAYYTRIYAYIYRRVGGQSQAEDFAGEVFLRLVETLKDGRGPRNNLLAWLYRVAHNLIVDHYRRQSKTELQSLEDWLVTIPTNPLERMEREQWQGILRDALHELTPAQQQVIVLKFVEGLSNAEIGIILGKPEGAVKSLQHRALITLRRRLEKQPLADDIVEGLRREKE